MASFCQKTRVLWTQNEQMGTLIHSVARQRKMSPSMGNADSGPLQLQGIAYCVNMCNLGAVISPKMKMRRPIKVAVLATVAVITLVSCGRTSSLAVQDNSFKAMLASLDWGNDTCYVYGHKTPARLPNRLSAPASATAYATKKDALAAKATSFPLSPHLSANRI